MIGEGANLGMTQRGRIEAAFHGIRLNTDAIDNSAGVNTSDMEVNIKIALSIPLRDDRLAMTARNALLAEMTDEVASLVLRNNYLQTLALSLAERRGMEDFGFLQRLMQTLEARGLLDRAVEYLPDDMALTERRRRSQPFTRPELSVLLAYAKLSLYEDLLESAVPDDPYLAREMTRYFPKAIAERFPDALEHHRLRREIIATQLGNSMINRGGPSLIVRIADQTGAAPAAIACAFAAVRDSYAMTALNAAIDDLDNRIPGKVQLDLYASVQDLLLDRIIWFLRNVDLSKGLADVVSHYRERDRRGCGLPRRRALGGGLARPRGAPEGTRSGRRARRARRPSCRSWSARRRARHRAGRRPHRQAGRRGRGDLFRRRRVLPPRPHRQRRQHHPGRRLFRPSRARSGARFDRRCRTPARRRHGGEWRGRRRRRRGLGRAAQRARWSASAWRSTKSPVRD